ncbi:MAG: hypothetical protein ACLUHA_07405 [Bacteroides stercoris]
MQPGAIEACKHVITQHPAAKQLRLAMRDLKSIYVEANRVDEFAALAAQTPGAIRLRTRSSSDSKRPILPRKRCGGRKGNHSCKGEASPVTRKAILNSSAFSPNAHYLSLIGKEHRKMKPWCIGALPGKLLEYPTARIRKRPC